MKTIYELRKEWKSHRQEVYAFYKETSDLRLTAEHFHITYPAAWRIVKREERETSEC